jgi:uncharacterized protein (TIGR00251 family)
MQGTEKLEITDGPGGARLAVKAVPGSSRDRVVGVLGGALKVAVSAPPEKGKANKAIAVVLAEALGVPARAVSLVSGPTNPRKQFAIAGLSAEQVRRRLSERRP